MIPPGSRVYDVSLPISADLCVWPDDAPVVIIPSSRIASGDGANISTISCSSHTGTHVDAPWHFVEDGKRLEDIALERWIGPCHVAEMAAGIIRVEPEHLEAANIPGDTSRLILKTANSAKWAERPLVFDPGFVGISPDAAGWVVRHGIKLIGIDYLSIEPYQELGNRTHRMLLENEVLILEGLDLRQIESGPYQLVCLPLRLLPGDGSPARALLIQA